MAGKATAAVAAFSTILLMGGAQAEEPEPGEGASSLSAISVTATKNPIRAFEYPGMVTVVGPEEIQRRQASSPDDLLRLVPNLEFTGGPRRTGESPSLRGFSGPDVITVLDGARQNFNSAHDGRFFIDPSLVRQVEVLRGPSSSLYGSGGTGGVIAFRTARAADFLTAGEVAGLKLSGGYQTVNEERLATATAYARPLEGLDLIGSVAKRNSEDIELGDGNKLDSEDDILSGLAKAGFEFGNGHRVEASFQRFDNTAEEPNNGQGLGGPDTVEKDIRSDTWRLAYGYHAPSDNLIDLDAVAYYTDFQADELRLDALGAGPQGELLKRDVDTLGFRVDNRSRFMLGEGAGVTLTYGAEAYRDEQDGAAGAGPRNGVPDADADFYGVFGQAEIAIAEPFGVLPGDLLIIPGLRYDRYVSSSSLAANDTKDDALSPRLGLSYLPTDWAMLFVNYAEAFRAPTFDELYLTGVHFQIPIGPGITNRFVPNPNLKPQTTQTVEFGAGLDFDSVIEPNDRFQVKASHFRVWGEDFIDLSVTQPEPFVDCNPFIPGACDGTTTSTNVPKAKLWGTEVEASYDTARLRLTAGFSTVDGENRKTGDKLGVLTPSQVSLDTMVKLPEVDSLVGWRVIAADDFDKVNDAADKRDGYVVHDLYFAWQPSQDALRGLRVDLGVDNAFDRDYSRVFTDAPEPGRNFKALLSYAVSW